MRIRVALFLISSVLFAQTDEEIAKLVEDRLLEWAEFEALLPADAEWVLFHFHAFRCRVPRLQSWSIADPGEPEGWTTMTELLDPLSDGHAGIRLMRRAGRTGTPGAPRPAPPGSP